LVRPWKKRYVTAVEEDGKVYYFDETRKKLCGEIDLNTVSLVEALSVYEFSVTIESGNLCHTFFQCVSSYCMSTE
jgi:hypothetical protein